MKRYTLHNFEHLNLRQRGQFVFNAGSYIAKRRSPLYIMALYEVEKQLFEVWFNHFENTVERIERLNQQNLLAYATDASFAATDFFE